MTSGKALDEDRNQQLRAFMAKLINENFDGNKAAAARELKVSQSLVQEFLAGTRGAGTKLLTALADYTGQSLDSLVGRPEVDEVRQVRAHRYADAIGNHPLWKALRTKLERFFSPVVLDEVEGLALKDGVPEYLDEAMVRRFAEGIAEHLAKQAEREEQSKKAMT